MKKKLAKLLLCFVLEAGAAFGVPMTPDKIEKIMKLSDTKIECVLRNENSDGKKPKR